jgi:hypothetical protein
MLLGHFRQRRYNIHRYRHLLRLGFLLNLHPHLENHRHHQLLKDYQMMLYRHLRHQ